MGFNQDVLKLFVGTYLGFNKYPLEGDLKETTGKQISIFSRVLTIRSKKNPLDKTLYAFESA